MKPAVSYEDVVRKLTDSFTSGRYQNTPKGYVRMVGLLFAPAGAQLARKEIIPNLNRFHCRSGRNIDFFCAGYGTGSVPKHWKSHYKNLPIVDGKSWVHSDPAFEAFRREIQERSTWRYSDGSDLLLANAIFDPKAGVSEIQFGGAVDLKLDEMVKIGAIISVETFFGRIFQYAEEASGDDPTWGFSDQQGVGALKNFALSLLPKNLGAEVRKAAFFTVRDLRKAA